MKTKTKILAVVEIAIVLCSVFLVALPAIAAEQNQEMQKASENTITTASEDDYVLDIYGNANEDDTIDMRDLTYVKLIFFGKKSETELADAKYDGKINPLDFIQIKLIIVGKEKELTIIDGGDRIVTVSKPVEKIIGSTPGVEICKLLKAGDKIVGVSNTVQKNKVFFPELCELPVVVDHHKLDYEKVYELKPDLWITYYSSDIGDVVDKLEPVGTKVVCFRFYKSKVMVKNVKKLGYILDREKETEEFIDFYEGHMDTIKERVKGIPEENRPNVYYEKYRDYRTCNKDTITHEHIEMVGGKNIAADLPAKFSIVDPEWVMTQNPDIIVHMTSKRRVACGYEEDDPSEMKAKRDAIMNRPELAKVPAVKTGRVYVYSYDIGESARHFVGMAYMAKWFYPKLFEDLDPKAIHQEYLTRFQGMDYDLDKHGVFVYHPEEHPDGK